MRLYIDRGCGTSRILMRSLSSSTLRFRCGSTRLGFLNRTLMVSLLREVDELNAASKSDTYNILSVGSS